MEMTDILKKHFADVEAKFGTLPQQVQEALIRLQELEQKQARTDRYGGSGNAREATWGEQFVEAEELKAFSDDHRRSRPSTTTSSPATSWRSWPSSAWRSPPRLRSPSRMETSAMSHDLVKVRTIRPHDTIDGLRAPGEEYERTAPDPKALAGKGVVEIVTAKAKATKSK